MAVMRARTMLAALAVCVGATSAFAFTMGDAMGAAGATTGMAAIGSRSAAPTINSVQKSLGASAQKMAQRTALGQGKKQRGPRPHGRSKEVASKSDKRSRRGRSSGASGWGGATQGWAKQGGRGGAGGGWASASGGGWGKSAAWAGAGKAWSNGGANGGWARPGGAS
jgi:hypothetical protein